MTKEEIRKQIGVEIRSIRKKLKLTQAELVEKYNNTPPVDVRIESHKTLSRYETVGAIPADKYVKLKSLKK